MDAVRTNCEICERPLGKLARRGRKLCGLRECAAEYQRRQPKVQTKPTGVRGIYVRRGVNKTTYFARVTLPSGTKTYRSAATLDEAVAIRDEEWRD